MEKDEPLMLMSPLFENFLRSLKGCTVYKIDIRKLPLYSKSYPQDIKYVIIHMEFQNEEGNARIVEFKVVDYQGEEVTEEDTLHFIR